MLRILFTLLLLAVPAGVTAQAVYLDHRGGALPVDKIAYGLWIVGARKGMSLPVTGETTVHCLDNAITIRIASPAEWTTFGTNGHAVAFDCADGGFVIAFRPGISIYQSLINHELLHTLGGCFYHSKHDSDTLHSWAKGPYSLTYRDAMCENTIDDRPSAPAPCFAELNPELTLYIPSIAGRQAKLGYEGVVDGYHQWHTLASELALPPSCAGFTSSGGVATLPEVRAYPDKRYAATLESVGGGRWRLVLAQEW